MNKKDLIEIFATLKNDFSQDELAFLALTSKAEGVLRDKIAYRIHTHRELPKGHLVCKEWKKIDLAVVNPASNPEIFFEFKAHSSIDYPKQIEGTGKESMLKDINGMVSNSQTNPDVYFIYLNNFISTDTFSFIPQNLFPSLHKYWTKLHKHLNKSYLEKIKIIVSNWINLLYKIKHLTTLDLRLDLTSIVEIKAGDYYGLPVSILAFIYGPINNNSNVGKIVVEDIDPKDEDFNSLEIILENEDFVEEIRQHIKLLYNGKTMFENLIEVSYPPLVDALKQIKGKKRPGKVIPLDNFSNDTKGLRSGHRVKFPESRKPGALLIKGTIKHIFKNHKTGKEEAKIKGDDGKDHFRYEREITKL
jgi:hypothetical protein